MLEEIKTKTRGSFSFFFSHLGDRKSQRKEISPTSLQKDTTSVLLLWCEASPDWDLQAVTSSWSQDLFQAMPSTQLYDNHLVSLYC